MKILIVDDSAANIEMLEMILMKTGHEIYAAADGQEGLEVLQRERIQLVLVDWMMPNLTGIEFVQYVRETITDYYVYIIMISAREEKDARMTGLESGVDDYLRRPFQNREMRACVRVGERIITMENALKRATEQVTAAKHEWEATADAIGQVVCLVDREGRVIRANRTIQDWGLSGIDAASGQYLHDVFGTAYGDFAAQLAGAWEIAQQRVEGEIGFEFIGDDHASGSHFHVNIEPIDRVAGSNMRDDSFAAVSIQDITERRKLELALEEEHAKSEDLLHNILPVPISDQLKEGRKIIADEFESASVLFADLVGFTAFTRQTSPTHLITLLNEIFSDFDRLTELHGLEKIKTIGDAYMAVCGVPREHPQHAMMAVNMALDMLRVVQEINHRYRLDFNIRIGVHSGPVVAGVIGKMKFAYDLWGDTVNTASRVEASGRPGKVHISETTAALLPQGYRLFARAPLTLKGIGHIQTFFVQAAHNA